MFFWIGMLSACGGSWWGRVCGVLWGGGCERGLWGLAVGLFSIPLGGFWVAQRGVGLSFLGGFCGGPRGGGRRGKKKGGGPK